MITLHVRVALILILTVSMTYSQETDDQLGNLSLLLGTWETTSSVPEMAGTMPGHLEYKPVIGGAWLRFAFVGQHPARPVWEAHGFMRLLQEEGRYEAYMFWGPAEPIIYQGENLGNGGLRLWMEQDGRQSGIDYHPRDGGVYQENWVIGEEGKRRITLKTTYRRVTDRH